ncbi:MAG: response regulator transcription factor [Elusimicrobia bacterium]|nr:response regulator transcription factor [Elusimicrobiota bacterium]
MRINLIYAAKAHDRAFVLLDALRRNKFIVTFAKRGKEVLGLLSQRSCDVLFLGQELTDEDSIEFLRDLRNRPIGRQIPVIAFLESPEAPISDNHGPHPMSQRLAFFQGGADECLTPDQDITECVARVKAVLRRTQVVPQDEVIAIAEINLNLTSYTVRVGARAVNLTNKELDLLYVFLSSPNRVLSRPYLIERVWGYNYFGSPRTVDVHVRRLREKLGKSARVIHTVPCVGYKLVPS